MAAIGPLKLALDLADAGSASLHEVRSCINFFWASASSCQRFGARRTCFQLSKLAVD